MNVNKLTRLFPNAGPHFIKLNSDIQDNAERVYSTDKKQFEGNTLVGSTPREAKSRNRFKIFFTVYAVRPADYDGYHIKELQDLLVKSGVIPDDNWFTLRGEVIPEKVDKEEEERLEIEIRYAQAS